LEMNVGGDLKRRSSLFTLSRPEIEATSQVEHSDQHHIENVGVCIMHNLI